MGKLVFSSAERPGSWAGAAEIPIVRDTGVPDGQAASPTERHEKSTAAARHIIHPTAADFISNFVHDKVPGDESVINKVAPGDFYWEKDCGRWNFFGV